MLTNILLAAEDTTTTGTTGATSGNSVTALLTTFLPLILIVVLMYFMMIRPQKKKQKEEQAMRDSVRPGDEVTTIGGVTGRVVSVKEDTITIETGADRNKITFKKWALQSCETVHEKSDFDDDDDDDDI